MEEKKIYKTPLQQKIYKEEYTRKLIRERLAKKESNEGLHKVPDYWNSDTLADHVDIELPLGSSILAGSDVTLLDVAKIVSIQSGYDYMDVKEILQAANAVQVEHLSVGDNVNFPGIGTVGLSISVIKSTVSKKGVKVRKLRANYLPPRYKLTFKANELAQIRFSRTIVTKESLVAYKDKQEELVRLSKK